MLVVSTRIQILTSGMMELTEVLDPIQLLTPYTVMQMDDC